MNECIIGIGSNIEAEKNIEEMLELLNQKVDVINISSMIKTKPLGITDQPDFTNGAVKVHTELSKKELKMFLKGIEDSMGRDRSQPKFGPRCIDLDIVFWNGEIIDPDYYTRDFLKTCVDEIA
jgi:2-amino-4-hydroxy-6-hydroxymethyldihydropteridine diphosphokinase